MRLAGAAIWRGFRKLIRSQTGPPKVVAAPYTEGRTQVQLNLPLQARLQSGLPEPGKAHPANMLAQRFDATYAAPDVLDEGRNPR